MTGDVRQRRKGQSGEKDDNVHIKDGNSSRKRSLGSYFLTITALLALVLVVGLFIMPSPVDPVEYTLPEPPELTGPMKPNNILKSSERLYEGLVSGPESIVVDGDHMYSGTSDGWLVDMSKGNVRHIIRFGPGPCGGFHNENTCGRILGVKMDKEGYLVVADSYFGLFRVNKTTGEYTTLFSSSTPINNKMAKFVNDLDFGADGKIYFTTSSSKFQRNQFPLLILEGASNGRLLVYDPKTKETTELLDGLFFANGVQMTKDKTSVLIVETLHARIWRYDIESGKASIWADNLPGLPDNIRWSKYSKTFWVGMAQVRQRGKSFIDVVANKPWLRGQIAKFVSPMSLVYLSQKFSQADTKAVVVELNEAGEIIRSIQDTTGEVIEAVSEVEDIDGVFYMGSYHAGYVGKLDTRKVPKF